MRPLLELRRVSRVHGSGGTAVQALVDIDLCVGRGELVAVMGPSGSGKSTLLTLAGGLDVPTSGRVIVEGIGLDRLTERDLAKVRRRHVGYVFQDLNLIPSLTAAENVALPRELDGVPFRGARAEALTVLERLGLEDLVDRFPEELSGGQQQRVAIARALIGSRRLLLADEPTGALDSVTGADVLRQIRAACEEGAAAVLVTHDEQHAVWADRVVWLRDGRVVNDRPPTSQGAPRSLEAER